MDALRAVVCRKKAVDVFLLVVVNAMWAAQYAAYKTASEQMGPITVSAWTFLIAALILLPFRHNARTSAGRAKWSRKDVFGFVLLGVLGLVPASALLAWGTARSTASNAALIYLTVPVLTALMASPILGERMTPVRWVALLVALAGVLLLSDIDLRNLELTSGRFVIGNLLVLAACASSAFYNVYSKELLKRHAEVDVLVVGYMLAVIVSVPLLVPLEHFSLTDLARYTGKTWLSLGVLSTLSWGLAMVLWMSLLKRLDVTQISVSIYLLPFLGVLISAVALGERPTTAMVIGGVVTLCGTVLAVTADAHPRREEFQGSFEKVETR